MAQLPDHLNVTIGFAWDSEKMWVLPEPQLTPLQVFDLLDAWGFNPYRVTKGGERVSLLDGQNTYTFDWLAMNHKRRGTVRVGGSEVAVWISGMTVAAGVWQRIASGHFVRRSWGIDGLPIW